MANYKNIESALIHGGISTDEFTGAVNIPIYQTSTYRQTGLGEEPKWEYSRTGNPTRAALEALIAELEGGTAGFAFGSGMAAITAVLSLFGSGDKILISSNVYGGTFRVLDKVFSHFNIGYSIEDTTDLAALESKITDEEIEEYYDENVFGDIDTKHILVKVGDGEDDLKDEDAKKLAEEIISKLDDGMTFDEAKEEYKDKITFEELGYQAFNASLESAYMEEMKELENGEYSSEPVKTSYGYHIVYRIDQKDTPKLKDVKDTIIDIISSKKQAEDSNLLYKALISLREEKGLKFSDTNLEKKYNTYINSIEK